MSLDWQTQVDAFLAQYEGITHRRYRDSLAAFQSWYVQSYNAAPDAKLLTDEEVRDYSAFLTAVKGYKFKIAIGALVCAGCAQYALRVFFVVASIDYIRLVIIIF